MNKKLLCCVFLICVNGISLAQILTHEALTSNGSTYSHPNLILHYATAQLADKASTAAGMHYYEGLLQGRKQAIITTLNEEETITTVGISPNPVSANLYINNPNSKVIKYEIYNMQGQLTERGITNNHIDVSDFLQGIYFLKLFNLSGEPLHSFKFMKS